MTERSAANIHIIASSTSWIDGEAVKQLEHAGNLPDVIMASGMPDLHPGRGFPVGAAIAAQRTLYPALVGNDIGCGMGLWSAGLQVRKTKKERLCKNLQNLEGPWEGKAESWLERYDLCASPWDAALGTIGGGNHFAEFLCVHDVADMERFTQLNLDPKTLYFLAHSGSRGLGEFVLQQHLAKCGYDGIDHDSEAATDYMEGHERALRWAKANRDLIASRFLTAAKTEGYPILDLTHNFLKHESLEGTPVWLHRKGAAPANQGPVVIPGSRGTLTYLVMPTEKQSKNALSVAHGAGRKWNRSAARERMKMHVSSSQLLQTSLGGHVICDDKNLLFEEAPQAYKDINKVIHDLVSAGLVTVVATFRPIVTYKMRHEGHR